MEIRMEGPVGARTVVNGRERDYFSGTGYLGLQNHPAAQQAAVETIQRYGLSSATSRGGYGENPVYDALEAEARAYFEKERVIYYASGYLGAIILSQGLSERYDKIFMDEGSHFSVMDAAKVSGKPVFSFRHCDPQHLAELLKGQLKAGERPLLISDGVFPISGEIAPLPEYLKVMEPYGGVTALDDAHAVGALGPHGRGTPDYYGITRTDVFTSVTLSKALGGFGGMIAASEAEYAEFNRLSRIYVAASPPPLPAAAASAAALSLARTRPEIRQRLWKNVARARAGLRKLGWNLADTPSPIVCLGALPGMDLARVQRELFERDLCVAHVKNYSSTPLGGALRVAIFATHSEEQIDRLVQGIAEVL